RASARRPLDRVRRLLRRHRSRRRDPDEALMFRIAHISDLHVLSRTGAHWRAMLFNKRITGYANTLLRRGRVHRREFLLAVLKAAAKEADHVVVTGDITNLALESEFDDARA